MAPDALALSGASFREPFQADGGQRSMAVTKRSDQNWPQRHGALKTTWSDRTVEQLIALPNLAVLGNQGGATAQPRKARAARAPYRSHETHHISTTHSPRRPDPCSGLPFVPGLDSVSGSRSWRDHRPKRTATYRPGDDDDKGTDGQYARGVSRP